MSSFSRTVLMLSRMKWSRYIVLSVVIIEPKTKTKFNDKYVISEYPQTVQRLGFNSSQSIIQNLFSMKKKFAFGHYTAHNVNSYRLIILQDMNGNDLIELIRPSMIDFSQKKYGIQVDNTRTGSLFFAALKSLKLKKNDEIVLITGSLYLAGEVLNLN